MVAFQTMSLVPPAEGARNRLARLVDRALAYVRSNITAERPPLQHVLITGVPGSGKTVALQLIAERANRLRTGHVVVTTISEIESQTIAPETLIEKIRASLETPRDQDRDLPLAVDWGGGTDKRWVAEKDLLDRALQTVPEKTLCLVLIDGLDLLMNAGLSSAAAQSRLRDLMQEHAQIMIVATARSQETQSRPERRIFQAFAPLRLPVIDASAMMLELEGATENVRLNAAAAAHAFEDRPEHTWTFAKLASLSPDASASDVYELLVDIELERLLANLRELPIRARRLFHAIALSDRPSRPTDLATILETESSDLGQPTKILRERFLIDVHAKSSTRKRYYLIVDRLLANLYRRSAGRERYCLGDLIQLRRTGLGLEFTEAGRLEKAAITTLLDQWASETRPKRFQSIATHIAAETRRDPNALVAVMLCDHERYHELVKDFAELIPSEFPTLRSLLRDLDANRDENDNAPMMAYDHERCLSFFSMISSTGTLN
tara:strand:+ start:79145 stop:80623 length:1479 start_codon:yes stop_codon:yes gene_type:complete